MPAATPARAPITALIDWAGDGYAIGASDDVSADVRGNPGEELVRVHQPIDILSATSGPAQLTMKLANKTGKYTPGNAGGVATSPIGRKVRVEAFSGSSRGVFDGVLRRIIPHGGTPDQRFVTIVAEDAFYTASRRTYTAAPSNTRSLATFRQEIVTALGFSIAAQRDLDISGPEMEIPVTEADRDSMLSLLNALSLTTGSLHYIYASDTRATGAVYRSRGRLPTFYTTPAVATYADTALESFEGFELGDEMFVNRAAFEVRIRGRENGIELWTADEDVIWLTPSTSRDVWAFWSDPAFSVSATYLNLTGITIGVTAFANSAKITLTAGAGGGNVEGLALIGDAATLRDATLIESEDAPSVAAVGAWEAPSLSGEFYVSPASALSRAAHVVTRHKSAPAAPVVSIDGLLPDVFTRLPGDRIIVSNSALGITAMPLIIGSRTLTMRTGGYWRAQWECIQAPALKTLFTIGGSAAEGIGGAGVLEN